jgi:hypothetical protein
MPDHTIGRIGGGAEFFRQAITGKQEAIGRRAIGADCPVVRLLTLHTAVVGTALSLFLLLVQDIFETKRRLLAVLEVRHMHRLGAD